MSFTRRKFLKNVGVTAVAVPFVSAPLSGRKLKSSDDLLDIHLFSKHLQFLDWKGAGQMAAELGFSGLDLTVRPKGHVLPENVKKDLPRAIRDIKNGGSACIMMTTAVADAHNALDVDVLKTAAAEGVESYRCNWFKYKEDLSLEASLDYYEGKIQELSALNKEYNIVGCYQNHSGVKVGASVWEVRKILKSANQEFFGAQYDIRHGVAEGGRSWSNGVKLLRDNIKTIVLKDFKWGKVEGKWRIVNVPIGEGMVDFDAYFKLLKQLDLKPPVSLHLEYPLGGAEKGKEQITVDQKVVFDAMTHDLKLIQKMWIDA